MSGTSVREFLNIEKFKYLEDQEQHGGTAKGFRERIRKRYTEEPTKFTSLMLDAWMEAATKNWQEQPRKHGPDLFSVDGFEVPEHLTRTAARWYEGDEDEEKFEKVHAKFATVHDLFEDAQIKLRKAAEASAAAEREMRIVDEARRRSKGRMDTLLREIADIASPPPEEGPFLKLGR